MGKTSRVNEVREERSGFQRSHLHPEGRQCAAGPADGRRGQEAASHPPADLLCILIVRSAAKRDECHAFSSCLSTQVHMAKLEGKISAMSVPSQVAEICSVSQTIFV